MWAVAPGGTVSNDDTGPLDPISGLAAGAAATHELFLAYVGAGFTRQEALTILIGIIRSKSGDKSGSGET